MKKILYVAAIAIAAGSLTISPASAQTKKAQANEPAAAPGTISKADAERRVLQRYPGANIVNVVETTANGHKVWAVSFSTTGAPAARKALVDQQTGKISY